MEELQAIIAALVGGARYGLKVRLPHALVMTMLFRRDLTSAQKIQTVVRLAVEHASRLASFATVYKVLLAAFKFASRTIHREFGDGGKSLGALLLKCIVDGPFSLQTDQLPSNMLPGRPERPYHALVAGTIGGYLIWGNYSSVNHQIALYLSSRIVVALVKRFWERLHQQHTLRPSIKTQDQAYPWLVAVIWGLSMVLFEESPHLLHKSLRSSMDEIYRYSERGVREVPEV